MTLLLLALVTLMSQEPGMPPQAPKPVVVLETELGNITLELDAARAPVTVANFLRYVDGGFYDGGEFSRSVRPDNEVRADAPIEVVQFRINPARAGHEFPPIPVERTSVTGLRHVNGTVSMARASTEKRQCRMPD